MPADLTPTPDRGLSTRPPPSAADIEAWAKTPLRQLPPEWRAATWEFWSYWSGTIPNQLALASRLRHWIADGLSLADARRVFEEMTDPAGSAAGVTTQGEFYAALAAKVSAAMRRARAARETAERRAPAPPLDPAVRGLLKSFGKITEEADRG